MNKKEYEVEIGGKKITALFTDIADQANGSVILKSEGTVVMATAVISKDAGSNPGWFNLTVEYLEKFYAAGKILGSQFTRREGRPSDQAFLSARVIDRTIRPLFDHHIKNAVQVIITVIAIGKTDPKMLGINAASVALHTSDIPWAGPIGGVHLSTTSENSEVQINNYLPNALDSYQLDLMVCGKEEKINMIESMSFEMNEEEMGNAFDKASVEIKKWEDFQKKIRDEVGKEKLVFPHAETPAEVPELFKKEIKPELDKGLFGNESKKVIKETWDKWKEVVDKKYEDNDDTKFIAEDYFDNYIDKVLHEAALKEGKRADLRKLNKVRDLYVQAGDISEVLHGSGIFYRGETHVMSVLTLAGPEGMKTINGVEFETKKRFMHHYNFPPYSAGETGRVGGLNRREMGHGFLAEKALFPVLPDKVSFPYTIRVVSESTASNGSTSQASICATTTALMDGGVPIKSPVAGIAMGVMIDEKDSSNYALLTDIQGPEDHHGDMDFKVAGTKDGITAIQLDIKVGGIPINILKDGLIEAKKARLEILEAITKVIDKPRSDISPNAPKILVTKIKKDQIGMIIGPGGKNVNAIREETDSEISIEEDGTVFVTGKSGGAEKALKIIEGMTKEYVVGDTATGEIVKLMDFGAFAKIGYKAEGLIHISEIAPFRVEKVSDFIKEGDKVPIKVIKVDDRGRLNLSIKEADKDFFKNAKKQQQK
ncbi:MAG: polyribonucleotide nucleotidyltransferase [Patescibacteria group bacterium]|nr:polyribonucleotide nucleotidyltransferase [Patescibacteria group bacterium]